MRPMLLYESQEFIPNPELDDQELMQDLNIDPLLQTMSQGDPFLYQTTKKMILHSETNRDVLLYRQYILKDSINNPLLIKKIYSIASEIVEESKDYRYVMKPNISPGIAFWEKMTTVVTLLAFILPKLRELRNLNKTNKQAYHSKALITLFEQMDKAYPDSFLTEADTHFNLLQQTLKTSQLRIGARIGEGLKGTDYLLKELDARTPTFTTKKKIRSSNLPSFAYNLNEMREKIFNNIFVIIKRFLDHTLKFIDVLRFESSFYVSCVYLHEELTKKGCQLSFPVPLNANVRALTFKELYDPSLAISLGQQPITNDLQADEMTLFMITGKNQGGKSTFLRSIGLAQLMMQCGLFVPATFFQANLCDRIFTYFTREEDDKLNSGKLDEELSRLDHIVDELTPSSLLLMNEPFASTTEREGSVIARDMLAVFYELELKVFIVTHFYELSRWMYERGFENALLLLPERLHSGKRSFKLTLGEPLPTSYGQDLFSEIIQERSD
ncbi:DNA mismatch repair protein MutS [Bacillus sp. J14TS2]|uniref:MutS-related protein n=1 Tax=Bacillus sp. J14TS2 TaxID=2807188 RepID=UPI001B23A1DE|nr:hypothetical protein [Bacillus sp. J14TS2]GIN74804.1 DNA mismatch repair protein MutS [Bacillus sp. J14TS2]